MKSSTNTKVALGFTALMILAVLVFLIIAYIQADQSVDDTPRGIAPVVLEEDTHLLDDVPGSAVTVVEFLDFECESCAAAFPVVEQARADYDGEVTFAFRYFPLPGHFNSTNAAIAVEAAAQQGKLQQMYTRMFETQLEWGEQRESRAPLFREYADDLGLDLDAYDTAVANPVTAARVQADFDAARALGLRSTPSFFVNDTLLELTSWDDLGNAIDEELGR